MARIRHTKAIAGAAVVALLSFTVMPAAEGRTPTLSGSVCKAWGGTYTSGKSPRCTVSAGAALYTVDSIVIPSKLELVIDKDIYVAGTITVKGKLTNWGTIHLGVDDAGNCALAGALDNLGTFTNSGTVEIYGAFNMRSGSFLWNSGTINAYAPAVLVNDGLVLQGSFTNNSYGTSCI